MFENSKTIVVTQRIEPLEIFSDFESSNKYEICDGATGEPLGFAAEKNNGISGFLKRTILNTRRPFDVVVTNTQGKASYYLKRPFYFFFSTLFVSDDRGKPLGTIERRFKILGKRYDFYDRRRKLMLQVRAPLFSFYSFPLTNLNGIKIGEITKKWRGFNLSGMLTEGLTDADTFLVDFGNSPWTGEQRALIVSAAISVDFDYFERKN